MSQAPCTKPSDRLFTDCLCSQDSLDRLSVDDFWQEVQNIQQSGSDSEQEGSVGDAKQPEEGEQEKEWLQDAGLSTLISEDSEDVDNVGLLSTLTRTQAAAVQRRLDTYTCSVRKKNKQPVRDVRDIFRADNPEHISKSFCRFSSPGCGREFFITDVAYSDQAAILQKQTKLQSRNSRRRKDDGTLPKLISAQCRLGVTRIGDLSAQDMKKVRQLALIDMTALCDILEVELKRHKLGKRKLHESCLFGVPLATLVENDQKIKPTTTVPLILQAMFSFLEKKGLDSEGILRVPGSQSRIKLETNFYPGLFSWEEVNPNDVAALLKKFIRELPGPLLTPEHLHTFNTVQDIQDLQQRLHVLNLLVLLLPEPNRSTLKALLEYLEKVVSRESKNRMSLWNVSTIMAPNLFMHKGVPPSKPAEGDEKEQAERAADVMTLLIQYQDLLWTIPNFLIVQVRKLNENSSRRYQFYDRRIKNLLRKMQSEKTEKNPPEIPNFLMVQVRKLNENSSRRYQFYDRRIKNLLRKMQNEKTEKNPPEPYRTVKIQAAHLLSDSMEVRLDTESRAGDALAQFHMNLRSRRNSVVKCSSSNGSTVYPDYAIYEVGGNIGIFNAFLHSNIYSQSASQTARLRAINQVSLASPSPADPWIAFQSGLQASLLSWQEMQQRKIKKRMQLIKTESMENVIRAGIRLAVLPEVNAKLKRGIPLPSTPEVSLVNPVLKVNQIILPFSIDPEVRGGVEE
ncbi:UNVERIFIED_CONTAM: hypothetical protein FKN15_056939 [Acipenser sinensis]